MSFSSLPFPTQMSHHSNVSGFPDPHLLNTEPIVLPPLKFNNHPAPLHLASLQCVLPPVSPHRHSLREFAKTSPSTLSPLLPHFSPLRTTSTPPQTPLISETTRTTSSPVTVSSDSSAGSSTHNALPEIQIETLEKRHARNDSKVFPIKRSIRTPRGIREVYICPFPNCDRISSEHSNMKAHLRLHTGERPYVCRVSSCLKSFRWKSSLTYHERALHSNTRPYQCSGCRKSFVERRKLRLHLQLCPTIRAINSGIQHRALTPVRT